MQLPKKIYIYVARTSHTCKHQDKHLILLPEVSSKLGQKGSHQPHVTVEHLMKCG